MRKKVLLVADVPQRSEYAAFLERVGYDVAEANDAVGAREAAASEARDLVVLLGGDGDPALAASFELGGDPIFDHTPVVSLYMDEGLGPRAVAGIVDRVIGAALPVWAWSGRGSQARRVPF